MHKQKVNEKLCVKNNQRGAIEWQRLFCMVIQALWVLLQPVEAGGFTGLDSMQRTGEIHVMDTMPMYHAGI